MNNELTLYIPQLTIQSRVKDLSGRIGVDYTDVLIMPIMKAALIFTTDIIRYLPYHLLQNAVIEPIGVKSYEGKEPSGPARFTAAPSSFCKDKNVLIVDTILDTGATIQTLKTHLKDLGPKTVKTCVLLDKECRRSYPITADYCGFTVPNKFLVGYGLDYKEQFRCLPDLYYI